MENQIQNKYHGSTTLFMIRRVLQTVEGVFSPLWPSFASSFSEGKHIFQLVICTFFISCSQYRISCSLYSLIYFSLYSAQTLQLDAQPVSSIWFGSLNCLICSLSNHTYSLNRTFSLLYNLTFLILALSACCIVSPSHYQAPSVTVQPISLFFSLSNIFYSPSCLFWTGICY
jgi:hypothetical protein